MTALSFPENPENGQIFSAQNGKVYQFNITTSKWSILVEPTNPVITNTAFNRDFATNQEAIDGTSTITVMSPATTKHIIDKHETDYDHDSFGTGSASISFETNTTNIKSNGSVSVGILDTVPRSDHVHPTDTSRAATTHDHTKSQITDFTHNHTITDLPVAPSGTSNTTSLVRADDSRLSDNRTPIVHNQDWTTIDNKPTSFTPSTHNHTITDLPTGTTASDVSLGNHTHSYAATTHDHTKSQITDFTHSHNITDLPVATNQEAIDDTNTTKIMTPSTTKLAIDEFASAGTSLPVYTSGDANKVLSINSTGDDIQWSIVSGGSNTSIEEMRKIAIVFG